MCIRGSCSVAGLAGMSNSSSTAAAAVASTTCYCQAGALLLQRCIRAHTQLHPPRSASSRGQQASQVAQL